jgi:hypothetical protein
MSSDRRLRGPETWTTIAISAALTAASIGLQYAIGAFQKAGRNRMPFDSTLTALSQRGSYVPTVIGRRRVGYIFGWAGDRTRTDDDQYFESAWHQLAVGPGYALHGIWENGKRIWSGTLTINDTPSGSQFTADRGAGRFRIYWGQPDQPIDAYLAQTTLDKDGKPAFVGVASRWPKLMYVVWQRKKLGFAAQWPQIEYEIEVRPSSTVPTLTSAPAYIPLTFEGNPVDSTTVWVNNKSPVPAGEYTVTYTGGAIRYTGATSPYRVNARLRGANVGVLTPFFPTRFHPGSPAAPSYMGYYLVDGTGKRVVQLPPLNTTGYKTQAALEADQVGESIVLNWTGGVLGVRLFDGNYKDNFEGTTTPQWTIGSYAASSVAFPANQQKRVGDSADDGINPAHTLWMLLTAKYPIGLSIPVEALDAQSFEDLAALCEDERVPFNISTVSGDDASKAISDILTDLGVVIYQNGPVLSVKAVRQQDDPDAVLGDSVLTEPDPQITRAQGDYTANADSFFIKDRRTNYKAFDLSSSNDGQALLNGRVQPRQIEILSVTDRATGALIVKRRALEVSADAQLYRLKASRGARRLMPGMAIDIAGVGRLRVATVQIGAEGSDTVIEGLLDQYSYAPAEYLPPDVEDGDTSETGGAQPDDIVRAIKVPESIAAGGKLGVLRVRANTDVLGANTFLSINDSDYVLIGACPNNATGGALNFPMGSGGSDIAEGPSVTPTGVDITTVTDLTGNDDVYDLGYQLALIGDELMAVRKVTAVSGGWRLDGIRRGMFGTTVAAHDAGDTVLIFLRNNIAIFDQFAGTTGATWLIKAQPFTNLESVDLDEIEPASVDF